MQVVLGFLLVLLKHVTSKANLECGYKQCPATRDGALNVHIITHSHMDAGWVKTFDEYYYGTKTTISTANVQLIYHSVLSELLHDKRRKFTFSETAYFWRWWKEQRGTTRATFRSLVAEGRIQFAGGGWVQADEATVDYLQLLDLYTWGLRKLNDTLGPCGKPKAAWQIDTYGHTREHTSLLAQMGFDGLFIGRVDHKEREAMIEEDRMEFMWRGSDVLGKMSDIMTHTLYNLYNAPDGFCFDFLCSDEPIIDDPDSRVFNADRRVNDFVSQLERQAKYYDHDNIMVTMGGDFTYQSAANWFMNIDKLINHINSHQANISDINIFYSTPSCYLKSIYLYGRRDKAVHTEKGDHLPYGSDSNTYWTGFYTSRPSLKYLAKRSHIFLQIVKQLTVISRTGDSYELHLLRHAVSLILHHDAITGTSQQHVTNDFIKTLTDAIEACTKKVSQYLTVLTPTWGGSRRPKNNQQFIVCHQLNISQCRFTESQEAMLLIVYNPLSVKTYYHVRLPAVALQYSIRDYNDEEMEYQMLPLPTAIINLPGRSSTAIQEVCFEAENIPPLGFTAYYITPIRDQLAEGAFKKKSQQNPDLEQDLVHIISNEYLKVIVNQTSGFLESIQHVDGIKIMVNQNFYFYSQSQQALQSGAYSFRPDKERPTPVTDKAIYNTIRGVLVKEIHQRFSDWVTQVIRLYRGEEFVELEWVIGPVPIGTDLGKEVVTIFKTNISSNGEFYTDSNSRQMIKRSCWNETTSHPQKKPVQACYYPVTSRICIQSQNASTELCVLTDRTEGGTSFNDGEIELMVHRRLLTDDGFGLEEPLNEEAFGVGLVVKGKQRIFFGNFRQEVDDQNFSERATQTARKWAMEPWLFFTSGDKISRRKWQNIRNKRYSALRLHGLPRYIHVLTLEPWKAGSVLLRLENTLEKPRGLAKFDKDSPNDLNMKASLITVELQKIFLHLKIKMVKETTLAANQWLEDARQMDWSTRYVYPGSDDGILSEDNPDYADNLKVSRQAETKDSEEEQEYPRKGVEKHRNADKSLSKIEPNYERKRRSLNTMNNNGTVQYSDREDIENVEKEVVNKFIDNFKFKPANATQRNKFTNNAFLKANTVSKRAPKLTFLRAKMKPSSFFVDLEKESAEESSLEDFSNKKIYSNQSRNRSKIYRNADPNADDLDDGITRSIYEMYYKTKPRRSSFKPFLRSSEETHESQIRKSRRNRRVRKNDRESVEYTTKKFKHRTRARKGYTIGMPFFMTRRDQAEGNAEYDRQVNTEEDSNLKSERNRKRGAAKLRSKRRRQNDYSDEEEDSGSEEERDPDSYKRKKRAINDEQNDRVSGEEQNDQDYVITLRPTQIRTFVIWFEEKRPYSQ